MGDKKEDLKKALETQFKDVSEGSDGQKKKESVETLEKLYKLAMDQDKADLDAEFRESEMELKEREMTLKENEQKLKDKQAEAEIENKKKELEIKERELAIKKSESLMKKIEIGCGVGATVSGFIGMGLYQKNFNKIYKIETSDTYFVPLAQRALGYSKNLERLAVQGVRMIFHR